MILMILRLLLGADAKERGTTRAPLAAGGAEEPTAVAGPAPDARPRALHLVDDERTDVRAADEPSSDGTPPAWAGGMIAVADSVDMLSGRTYRVWRDPAVPASSRRWPRRSKRSFVVEAGGAALAALRSWPEVVDWHERNIIATGWHVLDDDLAQ
jgi:hypothetical protein